MAASFSLVHRILFVFVGLIYALPPPAFGWGDEGHRIIGVIAYARLTPTAKEKIDALLAADKDDLTAGDFVSRTTWADKYRDSDRHTTKIRYEATRKWHFVDIEITTENIDAACDYHPKLPPGTAASAGPAHSCVIDKVEQFSAELRDPSASKPEKILALKFLLHLVGDLHQPLHVADNEDRGGNDVPVLIGNGAIPTNLHFYWDNDVVEHLGKDPMVIGASFNKQITKSQADDWSKGTATTWAKESFIRAKDVAYKLNGLEEFTDIRGTRGMRLDSAYEKRALVVAREQLAKAGIRLASVLNYVMR